jgi:hypothetical protein
MIVGCVGGTTILIFYFHTEILAGTISNPASDGTRKFDNAFEAGEQGLIWGWILKSSDV